MAFSINSGQTQTQTQNICAFDIYKYIKVSVLIIRALRSRSLCDGSLSQRSLCDLCFFVLDTTQHN